MAANNLLATVAWVADDCHDDRPAAGKVDVTRCATSTRKRLRRGRRGTRDDSINAADVLAVGHIQTNLTDHVGPVAYRAAYLFLSNPVEAQQWQS
jgi:hypothetical protein